MLHFFKEDLHNNTDPDALSRCLENYTRELTPAQAIHILYLKEVNTLETKTSDQVITLKIDHEKSLIKECLHNKKPQLINDIRRDPIYNERIDNVFSYELKNLLLMPLYDINHNIFALLWAGIPKGDINQFITQDIEHLQKLTAELSYVSPRENKENKENKEELTINKTTRIEPPALIKKIKSIFSKSKN
jgi:GAF domain-containing protein